jgi:C4-dicarboxylate-specific signal transduction histidine kinase
VTGNALQVLMVEDDKAQAVLVRAVLAQSTYGRFSLTTVQRLDEALDRLEQQPFDVVLLDLGLPDSRGLETLERIRRQTREMPIVIMTGLSDETTAVSALQKGAQEYLVKGEVSGSIIARAIRYSIERKHAEESARIHEAELAHLSRISTMGQMASGLAHELNQPLSAILNYASVCLEHAESGNGSRETMVTALREVMSETRRAGAIISRLRSFVRKQQPPSVLVDLNAVVDESINLLDFELRHRGIRPKLRFAENLPKVLADTIQIEQVLVNLIFNALETMSENNAKGNGLIVQTALSSDAQHVEVCVIDNGAGVLPENLARLFEPFFTTKSRGLGMGLNISRSIIEAHGGRLAAAANPGGGMRFCFTIPVGEGVRP